jgi:hypothetical protein
MPSGALIFHRKRLKAHVLNGLATRSFSPNCPDLASHLALSILAPSCHVHERCWVCARALPAARGGGVLPGEEFGKILLARRSPSVPSPPPRRMWVSGKRAQPTQRRAAVGFSLRKLTAAAKQLSEPRRSFSHSLFRRAEDVTLRQPGENAEKQTRRRRRLRATHPGMNTLECFL